MKKIISMLLAVVMCFSLMTVSFAAEMNFTDVKSTDWFYNDVKTAVEMGLVNGKSATTYAPNDDLTYAEAIKLAACMNMLYTQGEINIKAGSPWYQPYVDYCVEYNIIDKEYDYNANTTRAGYMGIFAKALPEEGFGVINDVPDNSIPDVPSSRAYAPAVYLYLLARSSISMIGNRIAIRMIKNNTVSPPFYVFAAAVAVSYVQMRCLVCKSSLRGMKNAPMLAHEGMF